jgi:phospholipase/carboxylesterase
MTDLELTHIVEPARAGDPPHPVLLLLHGRGTDETDLLPLGEALDPRLLIVAARAPFPFPWGGYAWYDLDPRGVGYPDAQKLEASIDLLRSLLTTVTERYPIDPARVYLGGFSMGSVMAGTMALLDPQHVAGAIILSGYLPVGSGLPLQPEAAAGHPFFVAHGTLDNVIPVQYGRQARDYLQTTPVDLQYKEYPIGHQISDVELRDASTWLTGVLDQAQART